MGDFRRVLLNLVLLSFLLGSCGLSRSSAQVTARISGRVVDQQGLGLQTTTIRLTNEETGITRILTSDETGSYSVVGLFAGTYDIRATKQGFAPKVVTGIQMTVNSVLTLDLHLSVASVHSMVNVNTRERDTQTSFTGAVIRPLQIDSMPINGRNYLDLLQLVPGVALNRQADPGSDTATPMLGERSGNTVFLIDGLPNSNLIDGGAAAPFNQDSILEFQVVTSGYKAEVGHGSGGLVNVISKSGTNDFHSTVAFFHRNYKLDTSDVAGQQSAPFLIRWDPSGAFGGPIVRDRAFFFASAERILESRNLNFQFPPSEPATLIAFESPFDRNSQTFDTRLRTKLDEELGRHRLTEQLNLINAHKTNFLPLSEVTQLPSTRINTDTRYLMLGFSDTALAGNANTPFVLSVYGQYRGEPGRIYPSNPQAGAASTIFNIFDNYNSNQVAGTLGQVVFGPGFTPFVLDQKYTSVGANLARQTGTHLWKVGWDFELVAAEGIESNNISNQLFATVSDFNQFGPADSGIYLSSYQGAAATQAGSIRLRDYYDGVYAQDDWRLGHNLSVNYGVRWDFDSLFPNPANLSPRVGVAWALNSKTVVRAGWGLFYDHFRGGVARDVPTLGGAEITTTRYLSFPRLFYGDPSEVAQIFALGGIGVPCISNTLTDAQISQRNAQCTYGGRPLPLPLYGVDHLNGVVAAGRQPIAPNTVIDTANIQQLSGFTPSQFANAASLAIGNQLGFFTWDPFGHLSTTAIAAAGDAVPVTVDPGFRTPHTSSMQVGIERELTQDMTFEADFYHRDIFDILGVKNTNLAFTARLPGHTGQLQPGTGDRLILGYGPWYAGTYNGISLSLKRRLSSRLSFEGDYIFANATDDAVANLVTNEQLASGLAYASGVNGPLDSFVGIPPVVTDPISGKTNAKGAFVASNGNPVPQAGKFYNGPALTSGPSDLALTHAFVLNGIWSVGRGFTVSSIFRAQSGFHYSASTLTPADVDGDRLLNSLDYTQGRNHFTAPIFINTDVRLAKHFKIREALQLHLYLEFFNMFNKANPAAVETLRNVSSYPFGALLETLPGREGQGGVRFDF